ncbi:MAG: C4-type zinc ribbon domain-containing protein [Acidobacteriota bacterium]|nr:C4-type zinc ribbon domain-containing protein [Vicinamibacterales bacterium]MEE2609631.1 C4-type zinc ribbon domain-containing protein [Acidobacteriota bacterium]MEE3137993.1 C4-type zinc ribbon domain-containing protein [Acidobacteriota bacterium]
MLPDLERLIRLQSLHNIVDDARRRIAAIPAQFKVFETRLNKLQTVLSEAKQQLDKNQAVRRNLEKEVSDAKSRLAKFKEHEMIVKTNEELWAVQTEIATAKDAVQSFEEELLVSMLETDTLTVAVNEAERSMATAEAEIEAERRTIEQERATSEAAAEEAHTAREALAREIDTAVLALFDQIAEKRDGLAVVEAKDNLCSSCHVRLRPQVFNDILLNNRVIQCESCGRILYFQLVTKSAPEDGA